MNDVPTSKPAKFETDPPARTYYSATGDGEKCSVTEGEELVKALMDPDFSPNQDRSPERTASGGGVSPLVLAVVGCAGLQKNQAYLSNLFLALVYTEESGRPGAMASFVNSQKLELTSAAQNVLRMLDSQQG